MYQYKNKLHAREKVADQLGLLRSIELDVTTKCNMHCNHCYVDPFANNDEVGLDNLQRATKELYDMGVCHYILQGGEPLVDFNRLKKIINMIYPDETFINMVSNGWALSKEIVYKLKELQVDKIVLSLDSGIREEHDANRCLGSFDKVKQGVEYVLEAGLLAGISTVVTHQSLYTKSFEMVYDYTKMKDIRLDLQIAMPVGKWDGREDILISPQDSVYIKNLYYNCPIMKNGQKMIKRDLYSRDLTCDQYDLCPAGRKFMAITATGEVLPCNFIQATLGNIKDRSITEMRNSLLESEWFDGKRNLCICGESKEYFDKFIKPNVGKKKPLDAYNLFGLSR